MPISQVQVFVVSPTAHVAAQHRVRSSNRIPDGTQIGKRVILLDVLPDFRPGTGICSCFGSWGDGRRRAICQHELWLIADRAVRPDLIIVSTP